MKLAADSSPEIEKSANHVCFAKRDKSLRDLACPIGEGAFTACTDHENPTHEFYTNEGGQALFRAALDVPLIDRESELAWKAPCRWSFDYNNTDIIVCCTNWYKVKECCIRLGCRIPVEVRNAEKYVSDFVRKNYDPNLTIMSEIGRKKTRKGKAMPKGEKSGMNVKSAWAALLIENEARASARNKKPLTDEQLVEAMQADFPDKADKTTITRASMIRGIYNKGTNMFAKDGAAGGPDRPISHKYGEDGKVVEGRQRKPKADTGTEPASAKSKTTKKAPTKSKKRPAKSSAAPKTAKTKRKRPATASE